MRPIPKAEITNQFHTTPLGCVQVCHFLQSHRQHFRSTQISLKQQHYTLGNLDRNNGYKTIHIHYKNIYLYKHFKLSQIVDTPDFPDEGQTFKIEAVASIVDYVQNFWYMCCNHCQRAINAKYQSQYTCLHFNKVAIAFLRDCRCGSWCFKSGLQCRRFDQLSVWTPITTLDLGSTACLSFNWEDNGLGKCYGRWHPRGWLVSPAQGFVLLQGAQALRMANSCYKSPFSPLGLQI